MKDNIMEPKTARKLATLNGRITKAQETIAAATAEIAALLDGAEPAKAKAKPAKEAKAAKSTKKPAKAEKADKPKKKNK